MDITSLRTMLLVHRHGSIAGAARALDVDPSSVSRTVATVEADLGVRVFHRTTRSLRLSDEGKTYLARLEPLIEEFEAAQEEARGTRGKPTGVLRLTASVAFADRVIIPLLSAFQSLYPEIIVDLQSSDTNLDLVENGIDLAIRLAPAPKGDVISTRLMPTQYRVVASPNYLKEHGLVDHPSDLTEANCIRFALPGISGAWHFRDRKDSGFEVEVSGNLMISNALALRHAAHEGLGVAILANWLIDRDIHSGALIDLFPHYECTATTFDTAAWALYTNRTYLPRKVRVMIDFLKDNLGSVDNRTTLSASPA